MANKPLIRPFSGGGGYVGGGWLTSGLSHFLGISSLGR